MYMYLNKNAWSRFAFNQSVFICSKCPEIHIEGFSIASRTTRLRPALTAAQLISYTMKEKEKLNAYKIAYGGVHIHCTRFHQKLILFKLHKIS